MRTVMVFVFIGIVSSAAQQPPTLDLTVPLESSVFQRLTTISERAPLELSLSILDLPDTEYFVGNDFVYTIELRNSSSVDIRIPWSPDPAWLEDVPDDQVFTGSLNLTIDNGISPGRFLTGATMYARQDAQSSIMILTPGMSVRVRAASTWSISGVRIRDYLAASNGRVKIKATYLVQSRGTLLSASPSSEAPLTLRMSQ